MSAPMREISVRRPGTWSGSRRSHSASTSSAVAVGAQLAADRVADPGEELDVGAVGLPGALADPEQVGRAVVPAAGERVLPGEGLLVAEDERLVARVEVDLVEVGSTPRGRCPQAFMKRMARSIPVASRS